MQFWIVNELHFFLFLQSFARLNNNINLTRYHEKKENDHCIF